MRESPRRSQPQPWKEYRRSAALPGVIVFHGVEWLLQWAAWALGNWALLEVLEYLGNFSVLVVVIFYFSESGDRVKQKHYQAWQVIDAAQGKGGSGGRIEAIEELNHDRVSLVGIEASGAFLQGIALARGRIDRCDLHASDLRNSDFHEATMTFCNLESANFRNATLVAAHLEDVNLENADLGSANLDHANLARVTLNGADLRGANLANITWNDITSIHLANIFGIRGAPAGFVAFAMDHGAVSIEDDNQWRLMLQKEAR